MKKETAQTVVKVISILGIIGSVMVSILGLLLLFAGPTISKFIFDQKTLPPAISASITPQILASALLIAGIIMLLWSIIYFIVSLNLMQYANWARIEIGRAHV